MTQPSLQAALTLLAFGLACLVPVLVVARRLLPREPLPRPRWSGREVAAVLATPFLLLPIFALAGGHGFLVALALQQVLFAATAWVALALARRRPQGLSAFGVLRRPPWRGLGGAALVYPALFLTLNGVGLLWQMGLEDLGRPAQQDVIRMLLELEPHDLFLAAPIVVLVGPLLEELLFRGFLQGVLSARLGDRVGIGVTSLLFAGLHGLAALPVLLGLALFLGWLQARTRSLWVPVAVHAAHNGLTLGVVLLASSVVQSSP